MEEPPAIPGADLWRQAEEILDSDDPLAAKLLGIHSSLVAWRGTNINSMPDTQLSAERRRDRNDIQVWLANELIGFFAELKSSGRLCRFAANGSPVMGHRLAPLGAGYALFESRPLEAGVSLMLDYADKHMVPQDAGFDQTPGLMDSEQVYVGDTRQEVAVSVNQLAVALRGDGRLSLL